VEELKHIFGKTGRSKSRGKLLNDCWSLGTLIRSPLVNHICFTGSEAGGLAVQKAASDRIVNVGLELGGKDPAYVRDDVFTSGERIKVSMNVKDPQWKN
jgi:hypothetical protein